MGIDIQAWHASYDNFELQVKEFNNKIKKSSLSKEELDPIYSVVKEEVNRLSKLSEAISAREEALNQKGCGAPTTKALIILTLLSTACKICEIAGGTLAIFEEESSTKFAGLGILIAGAALDEITNLYEASLFLRTEEVGRLAKLNKEGVENAKTFKKFIEQLRKIKRLEAKLLKQNTLKSQETMSDHVVVKLGPTQDLDQRISECLKTYEELPNRYRREDVYCRIISHLIQKLPPEDPLRQGLEELEPTINQDVSVLAQHSIPIKYFPKRRNSSNDKIELDDKTDQKWHAEEQAHVQENMLAESQEESDAMDNLLAYEQRVAHYQYLVMQRFKLKHHLPFLETPQGWQISPTGKAKRIVDNDEEGLLSTPLSEDQKIVNFIV